jgi:hypothetical protein
MNVEVKTILGKSIKVKDKSIPVEHMRYKGKSKTFVTWTMLPETPSLNADNETLYSVCQVDIDVFSDSNYLDIMKEIKKIMKENEWVWVEDSPEMYEEDTELYHRTITFEKERFIDNG